MIMFTKKNEIEITDGYLIHETARRDDLDNLKRILARSSDTEWLDPSKQSNRPAGTALYQAVKYGHVECVAALVAGGANVNYHHKNRPLSEYVRYANYSDEVKFSLYSLIGEPLGDLALDEVTKANMEIHEAIKNRDATKLSKHLEIIEVFSQELKADLIKNMSQILFSEGLDLFAVNGIQINSLNEYDKSVLHVMAQSESTNVDEYKAFVDTAIKHGIGVDFIVESFTEPPLFRAIRRGNIFALQALLEKGADKNFVLTKYTPLVYAIKKENMDAVNMLLNCGADASKINNYDIAALVYQNQIKAFTHLAKIGLVPKDFNIYEKPALIYLSDLDYEWGSTALNENEAIRFMDVLLRTGADVNVRNKQGWSPIMLAAKRRSMEIVARLLKYNPDTSFVSVRGKTIFDYISKSDLDSLANKPKSNGINGTPKTRSRSIFI